MAAEPLWPFTEERLRAIASAALGDGRSSSAILRRIAGAIAAVDAYPLAAEVEPALVPAALPAARSESERSA